MGYKELGSQRTLLRALLTHLLWFSLSLVYSTGPAFQLGQLSNLFPWLDDTSPRKPPLVSIQLLQSRFSPSATLVQRSEARSKRGCNPAPLNSGNMC